MSYEKDTYLGNALVKRDGVRQVWTKDEVSEYSKCMKDPVYFAETYGKVISLDRGLVPFELYPYQKEMFSHFNENRFNVVLACRQSGKSISSCMYILWYALFHPEQTIAILANKGATAREMLSRITLALENTPFFLQPGCKGLNKGSIEFSNNSRIMAAATSSSSIRGFAVNLLFLDEFAFVENAAEFYTSTYPVISSSEKAKVIITSTANGVGNPFHKIYEGAVQEVNEFKPFRVDWWDVPGRDEEWKKQTIANTSELQFRQEFGNTFFGTGNTLINADTLMNMKAALPIREHNDCKIYEPVKENADYIMTVDVSKGRGQDYSTFSIFNITDRPFKQVAVYRSNLMSPILFPDVIHRWAREYNEAFVIVESNDVGSVVANGLYYDIEYDNLFVESFIKASAIGLNMNRKTKRIGCSHIKDLLEENKLLIVDLETISECSTFEAKGQSFEASDGNHDDLMMNLVMFGWYAGTEMFMNDTDIDVKEMLYNEQLRAIENEITPFGLIDNGIEEPKKEKVGRDIWRDHKITELF